MLQDSEQGAESAGAAGNNDPSRIEGDGPVSLPPIPMSSLAAPADLGEGGLASLTAAWEESGTGAPLGGYSEDDECVGWLGIGGWGCVCLLLNEPLLLFAQGGPAGGGEGTANAGAQDRPVGPGGGV